ncbi:MAG: GTP pyrophosphokinase family protein [Butyrivibrio sp.]|nr:GTP pyrophosphokinase family protein [Butyrivibrio sp.]
MAVKHVDYSGIEFAELAEEQEELREIDGIVNDGQVTYVDIENELRMRDQVKDFQILMMKYDCALSAVRTKLDVLNKELSLINNRNPFESIKMRIKTPMSIYKKLNKKGLEFTIENINDNLSDIAGIRVICSFVDDIYMLAKCLADQDDITVLQRKDYIETPKKSGYRSLHLIIEIPIFLTQEKEYMKVEVQFRTIAMDFWASLEHKMKYKKNIVNQEVISDDLKFSADLINQLDLRMQQIREKIDASEDEP